MAEVAHRGRRANYYYTRMLGPKSSMERCRERRRRRIEMRRNSALAAAAAANGGVVPWRKRSGGVAVGEGSQPGGGSTVMGFPVPAAGEFAWGPGNGGVVIREGGTAGVGGMLAVPDVAGGRRRGVPVVGAVAVAGRQRDMEDAVTIRMGLCTPAINRCRPVHFFGVFDGHGGPHVAIMCKDKMHEIMEEEIMRAEYPVTPRPHQKVPTRSRGAAARLPLGMTADESVLQEAWRRVLTRAFSKTEMVALHTCGCGSVGFNCTCDRSVVAYSGSTAVAVVLTDEHVVVANCGDSRAVLYRGGRVIPLSFDHKPDRADEKVRVEASGGRVFGADTPRVEGILAMSRAIGDRFLKPYVISEPEVTFTRRDAEDEFLILASDGLWDVMSLEMTCRVARECLKDPRAEVGVGSSRGFNIGPPLENDGPGTVFPSRSASAAALLTRLALARKSGDNICVVVVDLKRATVG
ncbi:hypothetical protein BUALT_Bualt10G0075900 [Buddleja alternifolia]|uniref:protein-serine/threonine phosphatase n=1 Tax=Buddleja alternifolia TaxID=168488 RepID=A0AAV6X431_9LAMI|nr:hypothetical protein BUALT_Bualt10G0075900 [Buddleja alternifolia]